MQKAKEYVISTIKTVGITKVIAKKTAVFASLVGIATFLPAVVHVQPITWPIINATLCISTVVLGTEATIMVGLIPSLIALTSGLLPAVLAPMIPFIMVSNALLVLIFSLLRKKNYWLGVISASTIKFIFLFSTSSLVINLLIKKEMATKVAEIMSWPQLLTALAGGIIAWLILKVIKKK